MAASERQVEQVGFWYTVIIRFSVGAG